ncbi:MAG: DUF5671 domain-containing protein [Patescibacteria group bacterium]
MEKNAAKHFVLQLGSLISLYLSLSFLLVLLFGLVNIKFPDAAEGSWAIESASSAIRIGIAMAIVFFPTYLLVTRAVNKNRRAADSGSYLGLTRWLIYLSLLVGGGALLVDLVVVIMTFLEGEITQRFILKAVAVLVVIGAAFHYYLLDARGYWLKHEQKSILFAIGTIVVTLVALAYGFMNIKSPVEVRERRLDDAQVQDLQQIQSLLQEYVFVNNALPATLEALPTAIPLPQAPEDRPAYEYRLTERGFALCATFATATPSEEYYGSYARPVEEKGVILNPDSWQHPSGSYCFERIVTLAE